MKLAVVEGSNPSPCLYEGYLSNCNAHLERISIKSVERPVPRPGTALVNIQASAVNPHDWMDMWKPERERKTLGRDLAGYVEEVVQPCDFHPDDQVWGTSHDNTHAEFAVVPCNMLGRMPNGLGMVEAASLPTTALAGLDAFKRTGAPWSNTSYRAGGPVVLIIGGSGGAGLAAIQLAKAFGAAKVVVTCSASHFGLVKRIGADQTIDYRVANWWDVLPSGSIDIVLDCIPQNGAAEHALSMLPRGGRYVTLQPNSMPMFAPLLVQKEITAEYTQASRSSDRLDELKSMVEHGQLFAVIDSVYIFRDIREAIEYSAGRHTRGKIVLQHW